MEKTKPPRKNRGIKALVVVLIYLLGVGTGISISDILRQNLNANRPIASGLPDDLDYREVEQVYDSLRRNFDGELQVEELITGLKDGLTAAAGDPYTEYLDNEETENFDGELSGTFTGIGAELSREEEFIVIVAPLEGYPAEKAGLRPKDIIAEIDGESAYNISVNEAVSKIRGEAGTTVKLTIIRNNTEKLTVEIKREKINVPSVKYEILDGNIGYLKITRYGTDTAQLSREAASEFQTKQVKGVILDLRSNPGGLLEAAVDVSSLWLKSGDIVLEEKRGDEVVRTLRARGNALLGQTPTVILINEGSASASEITAGALKDHGKATLIGAKTYGKGSVQQLIDFNDGTKLKVTIARWFTPAGKNIDKEGIEPDKVVERTEKDFAAKKDPQRDAAIAELTR